MARSKGQTGATTQVRAQLEAALLALTDHLEISEVVLLRIRQAMRRAELGSLLSPAVEDVERMVKDVKDAKTEVNAAIVRLAE